PRRARADEDRVVPLSHDFLHGSYFSLLESHPEIQDVVHLFIYDFQRQPEARDLRPDHAAGARVLVEHGDLVAERREVARHGQGSRAGADAGDPAAVGFGLLVYVDAFLDLGVVLVVRGHPLQAADGDRLGLLQLRLLDAAAAAGGLAGAVAGAAEDSGEDVRLPVDHVGVGVTPCCDHPDVFGNWRVGRAGPLAIDNLVEVVGVLDVRRLQPVSLLLGGSSLPVRGYCYV